MKASDFIQREINTINRVFRSHRVDAGCRWTETLVGGRTVLLYRVRRGRGVRMADVDKLLPELSEALGEWRGKETPVRVQKNPHALEVRHPKPEPVRLRRGSLCTGDADTLLCGVSYGYSGEQVETVNLNESPHLLIVGTTGAGKSVLERGMLLSLVANNTPDNCKLVLIDMKNDDLRPLHNLPHTERFAYRREEASEAIASVWAEMDRRVRTGNTSFRLVLAIDELARLSEDKQSMALLNDILATGRSLRVNVIAATQHPTKQLLGMLQTVNFAERFVGLVVNANTAQIAAGRPETHAHMLPGKGAFLRIAGADMRRFQAYYTPKDDYAGTVDLIGRQWRSVATQTPQNTQKETLPTPERPRDEIDELADAIAPMVANGDSKNAMCKATIGRPYAGGHARKLDKALARLAMRNASSTTTTADAYKPPNSDQIGSLVEAVEGSKNGVSLWY